jgi:hypothetical protein
MKHSLIKLCVLQTKTPAYMVAEMGVKAHIWTAYSEATVMENSHLVKNSA